MKFIMIVVTIKKGNIYVLKVPPRLCRKKRVTDDTFNMYETLFDDIETELHELKHKNSIIWYHLMIFYAFSK